MNNKYIINNDSTIIDGLKKLNEQEGSLKSLIVVDKDFKVLGTVTDGDIRRALIEGLSTNECLMKVVNTTFSYLNVSDREPVLTMRQMKDKGVKLLPVLSESMELVDVIDFMSVRTKLPVDAVLMAGGKGVRLRPLTETIPKPLLPVGGKPIIDYNIDSLIENGIKHISVTVNYLHEQLEKHFLEPINGVQVNCIIEPRFMGTIGATQFIPKFYNDVVLVMNSDLFTNIDYEDFYLHFKKDNADMSVATIPYSVSVPYGIFELDGNVIKSIKEKPVYNYYANAGIYLIKRELLYSIPKNLFYDATDLINELVLEGKKVIQYPIIGYWLDIGCVEEYKKANELVNHLTI